MAKQQRRKRIGLMTNTLLSSYQIAVHDALERFVRARGCDLVVLVGRELQHPDVNEETQNVIFDWLSPESVDGLIALTGVLVNYAGSPAVSRILERVAPVPVVSIGVELPGIPSVTVDNRAGMRQLVEHFIGTHGCKRIAYISGPPDNQEADARLRGYRDALASHGVEAPPELIVHGRFTLPTGSDCMQDLLDRGSVFDAVIAANDYMALGAIDALRARGIVVPKQVPVAGFDDSQLARVAARPLTSVAQPVDSMAERALDLLLAAIDRTGSELVSAFAPQLVRRASCGCTDIELRPSLAPRTPSENASAFVMGSRRSLVSSLSGFGVGASDFWSARSAELVQALGRELEGDAGAFVRAVESTLEAAAAAGLPLENVRKGVLSLKRSLDGAGVGDASELERLWLLTLSMITEASSRAEGRTTLDLLERFIDLRHATQRLSVALDPESIAAELAQSLPRLGVNSACMALFDPADPERLVPILRLENQREIPLARASYARSELVPDWLLAEDRRSFLLMPLSFQADVYGIFAVDGASSPRVCELLRTHIGTAIKLGALQRRVIDETAARERADQRSLEGEVAIARHIQTALAPRRHQVPCLEISASMQPAREVGGDYYDVIAVEGGAWLCIGDVTGHGLLSGLIMLMIQSMVTALARARPHATPADLIAEVNQGLTPNVRERLDKEEHATMVAVRFFEDGTLAFAGSHEDLIIYRQRTGSAELLPTLGVWIGILDDVRDSTPNQSAKLEPGDILVLYTDGFVEARNAHGTHFGRERLCRLVEAQAPAGPDAVRGEMLHAVASWSALPEDDLTCLVARYTPRRGA